VRYPASLKLSLGLLLTATAFATGSLAVGDHPFETDAERVPRLKTGGSCVILDVTIHSAVGEARAGDVLVLDGKIKEIYEVEVPEGIVKLDGKGRHLAPGVIDPHSHIAFDGGGNEGTMSISAEVDISDVLDADDLSIYRALAGGVTTVRLLHGSANAIGGQHEIIKLKWGRTAEEIRFPDAPEGIKFALGENPKHASRHGKSERFPGTRMGIEAIFTRAFERALEYRATWQAFEQAIAAEQDVPRPRRDLRLEALVGILDGDVTVACHAYRADEILMFVRIAERYGFQIGTLDHALESYKVAAELAEEEVPVTTFGDWWAYKMEAYDAIPQNAALMDEAGALVSLHSDSRELMRRLLPEAGKSIRYAGLDRVRALALVTLNPAKQLGISSRVGSIEVGKDADLVLLSGDPLSSLSRVEWTMVDGEIEFERRDAFGLDAEPLTARPFDEVAVPGIDVDPGSIDVNPGSIDVNPAGGETLAIFGGTLHPLSGPAIENGLLLVQDGRILYVGPNREHAAAGLNIDATGKHVWPGIIALNTALGLREIGAVRATNDTAELGGNQPDLRVLSSINAASAHLAVTRCNGVTRSQVAPQGGGPMMGQSAVIDLDGDTWEELVQLDRDMLHIRFPEVSNQAEEKQMPEEALAMSELLDRAREYDRLLDEAERGAARPPFDARLDALRPYASGERRVALHAQGAQTILLALKFARAEELDAVLYGVTEGWKVVDQLAAAGYPVVVGPVLAVPRSRYDPYDALYSNPAVLFRAGVEFAIQSRDTGNPRNVAFHAAMARAFGLPREEALRAITLYPARILGVEDQLGSLEPGKIADLVITDGDLLEVASTTDYVIIGGRQIELTNRQTRLYDRYRSRLERVQAPDGR